MDAQDYLTVTRGISPETYKHFGLGYDIEKHAIAIPVFKRGELINIRYRYISPKEKQPKYTQEKGCEVWLYNEDGISKGQEKGGVLVVEGEFDLMSTWQAGIKNVISPASGKDSYGIWLELLDTIPKVYIAYDNDKPGKSAAMDLATRVGVDKCYEVIYPGEIKDANEYFKQGDIKEFKELIKSARPFFKYTFAGIPDIIESIRTTSAAGLKLKTVPFVEMDNDWMVMVSGSSNAGKTTYVLNIANELAQKGIQTLILPFERGVKTVGKRFLQVRYKKTNKDFDDMIRPEWEEMIQDSATLPIYFSMPKNEEITEIISKSKRIFNTRVVIVDHLNYLVRRSDGNENTEVSRTLQEFKLLAQENDIIFIIVHHIKKPSNMGIKQKLKMEDLKGSSSVYQDPEAVIMLSSPENGQLEIDVVKNKGPMGSKIFNFNPENGSIEFELKTDIKSKAVDGLPKLSGAEAQSIYDEL